MVDVHKTHADRCPQSEKREAAEHSCVKAWATSDLDPATTTEGKQNCQFQSGSERERERKKLVKEGKKNSLGKENARTRPRHQITYKMQNKQQGQKRLRNVFLSRSLLPGALLKRKKERRKEKKKRKRDRNILSA